MIDLKSVSWGKLLVAAAMTLVPAMLSYCKASDEAASVRSASRAENEAGYKTLVESVRNLETVVAAQQQSLALLVRERNSDLGLGSGNTGSAGSTGTAGSADVAVLPASTDFPPLPDTPDEALQLQERK